MRAFAITSVFLTSRAIGLPTIAIPTTSGTASETNGGGLITDTSTNPKVHRKLTFSNPSVAPVAILLDPTLTVGMPARGTAACGMDVLTHAIVQPRHTF
ncbi:MAG: iron-containing alcohol dehydrogenase [Actinomycetota bacterium]